ncbi:hypothetical protein GCM10011607_11920 [Shewanella inventionis]|uniref:Uncharacterized protein n=1 Tax=Shewanella inventionis TaxID=1738770 RepID=A0ABQ1IUT1_9GAMM|nr:hypothetical protein [Shewanella inventionis]GGB53027.1 hypothetical protein GCM10011607_11920 [Shewanella inventionis]
MNHTKMNEFKSALYEYSGFTPEQMGCSKIEDASNAIAKLLNDDLLMRPNNQWSFSQRTQMVKIKLLESALSVLADDDYHGSHNKIKELISLIYGTGIGQENSRI